MADIRACKLCYQKHDGTVLLEKNEEETKPRRKPRFFSAVLVSGMEKPFLTKRFVSDSGFSRNSFAFFLKRGPFLARAGDLKVGGW